MDSKVAKEFLHIRDWLSRAGDIVDHGRDAYQDDPLLQEAGDSLMMKLGEAPVASPERESNRRTACSGLTPSRIATGSFISTTRSTGP